MFNLTNKKEIDNNAPAKPGVYKIYWIKNGHPVNIRRLAGDDDSGLLYIGQTNGTLEDRINQFRCTAFLNSANHSGALKYRSNVVLNKLIQPLELFAEVTPSNNAKKMEEQELERYISRFGEVPPLNG